MTRLDAALLASGPIAILVIWILLPGGVPEGSRTTDAPVSGVVAELVGYAPGASATAGPRVLGRGAESDFRLHNAPVARRAAVLLPPQEADPSWAVLPADPGLTLELLPPDPSVEDGPGIAKTSLRPWADRETAGEAVVVSRSGTTTLTPVRLRQVRLWGRPGDGLDEPEVLWIEEGGQASGSMAGVDVVSCAEGRTFWKHRDVAGEQDPCTAKGAGWQRARGCTIGRPAVCLEPWSEAWGVRLGGTRSGLLGPWGDGLREEGFSLSLNGPTLRSIRVGIDAASLDRSESVQVDTTALTGTRTRETLGALHLRHGDVLRMGRTRFLVHLEEETEAPRLIHVRRPQAAGYFRSSAGHDAYHPNRRALWTVPPCDTVSEELTLVVRPQGATRDDLAAAELAARDRRRQMRIDAAALHRGVPHEVPAVVTGMGGERALLSMCAERSQDGELSVSLSADSSRDIRLTTSDRDEILRQDEIDLALGHANRPTEALVELDGNLVRIAPAAAPRLTRRVRLGLAGYLIFVLMLQAVPLTWARTVRRHEGAGSEARPAEAWPVALSTPSLQQLAASAIVVLLFVGANFQLFLALHPELAGKPDYLQAFLQGVVVVSAALCAAAGFASGAATRPAATRPAAKLPQRCAGAALGAALALAGAAAWRWWDAWGVPEGLWLTALRNETVASAAAGSEAFGRLLLQGAGAGFGLTIVLLVSAVMPWPRWAAAVARMGLRVPVLGFVTIAAAGLALGLLQSSALAFELGILGGLAWYAGVYWAFVRHGRLPHDERLRHRAAVFSLGSGAVMVAFLVVFFVVGSDLPDLLSFVFVALGLALAGVSVKVMVSERFTSLLRVLCLWAVASVLGGGFASLVLTDMGSVAAWIPALLAGLFLWLVRPEEQTSRVEEPRKALCQLLLALGLGLVLLGVLDVFKTLVQGLEWQVLERPRQRLDLAEDVSYITAGEWITQVRWLASHQDDEFHWVPNVNSDVAIFGVSAGLGTWLAVLASLLVLTVAGCAALAADRTLRRGYAAGAGCNDRLPPALYRGLGLLMGMVSVLLIAQWLVHLATGVVLHLPITGLVFPWISHGNTTHLLYVVALIAPMAAVTALDGSEGRR